MADRDLAPNLRFPERTPLYYERKEAPSVPGNRGPLRFEEGIATDTDVPNDFVKGVHQGLIPAAGRPNHNQNVYEKPAEETMKERAHVGSAAWVESPEYLGGFSDAAFGHSAERAYQMENSTNRPHRLNPATVTD